MMHLKSLSYVIKKVIRKQGDTGWEKGEEECEGWEKKRSGVEKGSKWVEETRKWLKKGRKDGWKEKRVGEGRKGVEEMRKGCDKWEDTPLSNPAKVIFKFTHRTIASLSILILSLWGEMAGLYAFHVFVSLSSLVVCVEVYGPVNS